MVGGSAALMVKHSQDNQQCQTATLSHSRQQQILVLLFLLHWTWCGLLYVPAPAPQEGLWCGHTQEGTG
jgi:hypothetical protein